MRTLLSQSVFGPLRVWFHGYFVQQCVSLKVTGVPIGFGLLIEIGLSDGYIIQVRSCHPHIYERVYNRLLLFCFVS